jgi:hypothetical protein
MPHFCYLAPIKSQKILISLHFMGLTAPSFSQQIEATEMDTAPVVDESGSLITKLQVHLIKNTTIARLLL